MVKMKSRQGHLLRSETILAPAVCHVDNALAEGLGNTWHAAEHLTLCSRGTLGQCQNIARPRFLNQALTIRRDEVRKLFLLCWS
jgi:hypothetical protein